MNYLSLLKAPVVSEKSLKTSSLSNAFTFVVSKDATKETVKKAFEELYGVKVAEVRIHTLPRKERSLGAGRVMNRRRTQKRAIIKVVGDASVVDITTIRA